MCKMHYTRETEAEGIQSSARVEKHDGGFIQSLTLWSCSVIAAATTPV